MKFKLLLFFLFACNVFIITGSLLYSSKENKDPSIVKTGVSIEIGPGGYYYGCYPYYYGYPSSGFNFGFYIGPRSRYYYYCPPGYYYRYYYPRGRYYYYKKHRKHYKHKK
ncbi:MAG: hypothetical protein Tsb0015_07220 [Simkaniaceae bacterium]